MAIIEFAIVIMIIMILVVVVFVFFFFVHFLSRILNNWSYTKVPICSLISANR